MADVARDAHVVGCSAWRRRNRRLRAFWRHEQQAVRMAVAAATHHSYDRSSAHACTQTDLEYVTPAPVIECVAPAPAVTFVVPSQQLPPVFTTTTVTTDDLEEFTAPVCNQVHQELIAASEMTENFAEIPVVQEQVIVQDAVYAVPAPVEYIAPAPAVYAAPAPVEKFFAPAPAVYAAPAPVEKFFAPAPAVYAAPAPSVEYIAPAPAVYAAPAPVVELLPVPAVVQAPTSAVENIAPVPSGVIFGCPSANACGGEYCTRAWCPSANACGS